MRNKFRIRQRPTDGKFTLQRQSWFGWWRFVDHRGKVYEWEHFQHGNDYYTFDTLEEAGDHILEICEIEDLKKKRRNSVHNWR